MFEEIKTYFVSVESGELEATDFHEESDKGHGRIETRSCWTTTDVPWSKNREEWKNLSMFARVQATRIIKGKTTVHNRYYISSLNDQPVSEILRELPRLSIWTSERHSSIQWLETIRP
ncbi:MAG: hypothetical protein GY811_04210 [Myxococcales bacterium]|nr:hypothetical protein [Myxococcales bacterium]